MYDIFMFIVEKSLISFIIIIGLAQLIDAVSLRFKKHKAL